MLADRNNLLLFLLMPVAGCSAHPITSPTARSMASALSGPIAIVLLKPVVRIARNGDARVPPTTTELVDSIQNAAIAAAHSANATLIDCRTAQGSQASACEQLEPLSSGLARGSVKPAAIPSLRQFAEATRPPACVVLSSLLVAEMGPAAYYNSMTGQMGAEASTSAFSASLTSCDRAQVVWKNEVLLRAVPLPSSSGYAESLQALFGGAQVAR